MSYCAKLSNWLRILIKALSVLQEVVLNLTIFYRLTTGLGWLEKLTEVQW